MLFALAEKLGVWDVDALGHAMPGDLLTEWSTYLRVKTKMEHDAVQTVKGSPKGSS